ncbi:hypothetical protein GCM10010495_16770 [Kitasatospora herbaricolor]|nr:hypothetical protein GCM10010495_16770 [Kitasatospora herbaricolor]
MVNRLAPVRAETTAHAERAAESFLRDMGLLGGRGVGAGVRGRRGSTRGSPWAGPRGAGADAATSSRPVVVRMRLDRRVRQDEPFGLT